MANGGLTSIPHAILGDFRPVIAVEPELRNFMCLEANSRANGAEMICHHAAAAASPGTGILKLKGNPTHHFLGAKGKGKGERVDLLTVDLVAQAADRVSLVKVDVQGGEADVLRGAGDLLRRREAAWLVEVCAEACQRRGHGVHRRDGGSAFRRVHGYAGRPARNPGGASLSRLSERASPEIHRFRFRAMIGALVIGGLGRIGISQNRLE